MTKRDIQRLVKKSGGYVTRSSYAAEMGIHPDDATKHLSGFVKSGLLEKRGVRRWTTYVLPPKPDAM